ncbi:alkaline phosphatase, tissue-nonspecific isozyme-like isoform X2 [Achroia grisella]|nr:alkaline phosphatase, tissue-nonspecific isozyme-like isoform X2 [Achroia grisella]
MVPDSACTATALLCGMKVNSDTVGVDASVKRKDCLRSLEPEVRLKSIAAIALESGKSAGFVTTMRVTHATPSPLYGYSADRTWECDANIPPTAAKCKDLGRQLIEDWPGRDLNVILGGGRLSLVSNKTETPNESTTTDIPRNKWVCVRQDGLNLIDKYKKNKEMRGQKYAYVSNLTELQSFNANETDYLLGIFSDSHLDYEYERNSGPAGMPSISDMVIAAINVLKKNEEGFFLMVEGGNIDMAHHRGRAKVAIEESAAMEEAVRVAVAMTDEKDTLLIVTSDHTHTLNINGYPNRGSNIFGIAGTSPHDGINYTTLSYSTGGPSSFKYYVDKNDKNQTTVVRQDPSLEQTNNVYYKQNAGIVLDENSHGGGDVIIYAKGPHSHLFHNIHEQHYVYYAVLYASKMGPYASSNACNPTFLGFLILFVLLFLLIQ